MLDGVYLILVFASNDEAVNSLAAEITEISAANKLKLKFDILELIDRKIVIICIYLPTLLVYIYNYATTATPQTSI